MFLKRIKIEYWVKLSIIIPVYNGKIFIESFANAINKQTVKNDNYELIIIDNGSTDASIIILEKYFKKLNNVIISPRIKFNPIFYTFMEYSNCMLMNKINNSLAIAPIARVPNLYDGIPKQIFSIYGNYGELYGATEEKVSELVKPSIQTLNESR